MLTGAVQERLSTEEEHKTSQTEDTYLEVKDAARGFLDPNQTDSDSEFEDNAADP